MNFFLILIKVVNFLRLKQNFVILHIFQLHSTNYIEDVTWWHEDMNFILEWQNNIL